MTPDAAAVEAVLAWALSNADATAVRVRQLVLAAKWNELGDVLTGVPSLSHFAGVFAQHVRASPSALVIPADLQPLIPAGAELSMSREVPSGAAAEEHRFLSREVFAESFAKPFRAAFPKSVFTEPGLSLAVVQLRARVSLDASRASVESQLRAQGLTVKTTSMKRTPAFVTVGESAQRAVAVRFLAEDDVSAILTIVRRQSA